MKELNDEFARVLGGEATADEVKDFLVRSIELMSDPGAIVAGAQAMRERMIGVIAPKGAIDVCGTGGDGAHTLNISTAVAFVVAGAGVPVAKHGNRAMSSKSGAADVLEALGVKLTADAPTLERCLAEANIAFLFAQNHHPALRHIAAARRALGHRTIFNLLGPLANPAGVKRQLVGVFAPEFVEPVAEALRELGAERAWVVHGAGGVDELSNENGNHAIDVCNGEITHLDFQFVGAAETQTSGLLGAEAVQNAQALHALLSARSRNEAYRQAVELNAGAALVVAGAFADLGEAMLMARESLESGEALARLDALVEITQAAP